MNHHDVGRDRGGIAAALATVTADVTIAGISSDRLYPLRLQHELGELIPTSSTVEIVQTISATTASSSSPSRWPHHPRAARSSSTVPRSPMQGSGVAVRDRVERLVEVGDEVVGGLDARPTGG